eukprot:Transcript_27974.p1 GENE.Transcript_27974~~Transcript_27974.p1  ORF type:complete len:505 (+),score=203.91 Transcript_27974:492-2006(+)
MARAVSLLALLLVRSGSPLLASHPAARPPPHALSRCVPRLLRMQTYSNRGGGRPGPERGQRQRPKKDRARPDFARNQITCYGCGAELQMETAGRPGYVEPERYELKASHRQLRQTLCARCRAMTQGEILPAVVEGRLAVADGAGLVTPDELRAQLLHLRERKALCVLLVDLSDVSGSFLPRVRDLIGPNPVMLVGTKADLLPRGTEQQRVLDWMAGSLAARLNVIEAHLLSAKTGEGMGDAVRAVMGLRKGRDVYVMGAANVGKSLFIGALLDLLHAEQGGRLNRLPISSATPGTTLRTIPIDAFSGGSKLYDTPGVHLQHRLTAQLLPKELQAISPRGKMKPYTPPLGDDGMQGRSFFWGGVARLDVVSCPPAMRLTFCGFGLRVHSCATAEADEEHAREAGVSLTPPNDRASAEALGPLQMRKRVTLTLTPLQHTADIAVSGLGWVAVSALPTLRAAPDQMRAEIDVWVPKRVEVFLRPPMPVGGLPAETADLFQERESQPN